MSTWLKLLPLELDSIEPSTFIEPDSEVSIGEELCGKMSLTAKKLYTLGQLLERDSKQNRLDAEYCSDRTKKEELLSKAYEWYVKSEALMGLMWICIREDAGLWDCNIGIRSGFVVVKKPQSNDAPDIFRRLLGGL